MWTNIAKSTEPERAHATPHLDCLVVEVFILGFAKLHHLQHSSFVVQIVFRHHGDAAYLKFGRTHVDHLLEDNLKERPSMPGASSSLAASPGSDSSG